MDSGAYLSQERQEMTKTDEQRAEALARYLDMTHHTEEAAFVRRLMREKSLAIESIKKRWLENFLAAATNINNKGGQHDF